MATTNRTPATCPVFTKAQAELMRKLGPDFTLNEDYTDSDCPLTYITDVDGVERFHFTRGNRRAFQSLIAKGAYLKVDSRGDDNHVIDDYIINC